ncbi:hypothetical protein KY329_00830 [Candidatus Woesearchaeota archaeon]|nr:hypothetical protein [Candidatus Woesearchaeota archaeon]
MQISDYTIKEHVEHIWAQYLHNLANSASAIREMEGKELLLAVTQAGFKGANEFFILNEAVRADLPRLLENPRELELLVQVLKPMQVIYRGIKQTLRTLSRYQPQLSDAMDSVVIGMLKLVDFYGLDINKKP